MVVVLARVHDDLVDSLVAKGERERGALDELRPVADDGDELHGFRLSGGYAAPLEEAPSLGDAWMSHSPTL